LTWRRQGASIKTSKVDLDLIKARLKDAKLDFEAWQARQGER